MEILLPVLLLVVVIFVVIGIYGSRKDKAKKSIENNKKATQKRKDETALVGFYSKLKTTIISLEKELKNFKPSIGIKSMSDINKEASDTVKAIKSSQEYMKLSQSEELKNNIVPIVEELLAERPNNWSTKCSFAINQIMNKADVLQKAITDKHQKEDLIANQPKKKKISFKWKKKNEKKS